MLNTPIAGHTAVTAVHGAVAAGGDIGQVHVTSYAAPREPAVLPHQVGVIPSRAQSFQHRAEADRLRAAVSAGGTAVLCQVLTGMGGVGKTQLASDYAHHAWDNGEVDALVWVTAAGRSAIVSSYAQAGVEFCAADPGDPERAAEKFLAWLRAKPYRWLVVLDDVADPADLRGLWPPAAPHGRTLVTTRRRDAALTGTGRRQVQVGLFTLAEAAEYLAITLAAHSRTGTANQLAGLAADLGCLPLALSQAVAYMVDSGLSVTDYRTLLSDRTHTLADAVPEPAALPDDQTATIAAVWSLSIDRADERSPVGLARPLLRLAAMLDPNGIPVAVLTSAPAREFLADTPPVSARAGQRMPQAVVTAQQIIDTLRTLHRLSLIDHIPEMSHQAVRIHALVQRATRDTLTPAEFQQYARTAADALLAAWPVIERDTALTQALRANTTTLATHAEQAIALFQPGTHDVFSRAGRSLGESGQPAAAASHFQHLEGISERHLGPSHPNTLAIRTRVASWRGRAGDPAGAAAALEHLLADQLRILGPNHPNTLTTRNNLAHWRGNAGDLAGAAAALQELLADRLRILGPNHPQTLITRHNLADLMGDAGNPVGAASAFQELLADRLRILGPDHPHILTTRNNLAHWRGKAGDLAGAATAFEELLADTLRILGHDQPDTFIARNNLAIQRGEAGDPVGAASAFQELLADRLRILGPNHPDTLATRVNLACWRGTAGDLAGAATAFEELLADTLRILGPDHPQTLITQNNLAHWRGAAGDLAGAAAAMEEALSNRLRVLGPSHPDTLASKEDLAYWREKSTGNTGTPH